METQGKRGFFYGWVIVAVLFMVNMIPMVLVSNYSSFFQVPICEELGVNYAEFSIQSIVGSFAGMVFSAFMAGRLGKGNLRVWMLVCGLVVAVGNIAQSQITELWQFFICRFVVNFAMNGITFIPINTLLARWFDDRKGFATSLVFSGAGVGGVIFSPILSQMIIDIGWRNSYICIAIATAVVALLLGLLVVNEPRDKGQSILRKSGADAESPGGIREGTNVSSDPVRGLTKVECLKTPAYWLMLIHVLCGGMMASGVITQLPTFDIELGLDYAVVMVFYSAATIVCKLVLGPLFDKVGVRVAGSVMSVMLLVSMVCLLITPQFGMVPACIGAALLAFNSTADLSAPLTAGKLFGYSNFADVYGLINVAFMLGCMFGPTIAASIRTVTGSYEAAWLVFLVVATVLWASLLLALRVGKNLPAKWHE